MKGIPKTQFEFDLQVYKNMVDIYADKIKAEIAAYRQQIEVYRDRIEAFEKSTRR